MSEAGSALGGVLEGGREGVAIGAPVRPIRAESSPDWPGSLLPLLLLLGARANLDCFQDRTDADGVRGAGENEAENISICARNIGESGARVYKPLGIMLTNTDGKRGAADFCYSRSKIGWNFGRKSHPCPRDSG